MGCVSEQSLISGAASSGEGGADRFPPCCCTGARTGHPGPAKPRVPIKAVSHRTPCAATCGRQARGICSLSPPCCQDGVWPSTAFAPAPCGFGAGYRAPWLTQDLIIMGHQEEERAGSRALHGQQVWAELRGLGAQSTLAAGGKQVRCSEAGVQADLREGAAADSGAPIQSPSLARPEAPHLGRPCPHLPLGLAARGHQDPLTRQPPRVTGVPPASRDKRGA